MSKKKLSYEARLERHTQGLTAVSTGVCGGCPDCLSEFRFGQKVPCECRYEEHCDKCKGTGRRPLSQEEFEERVSSGHVHDEGSFSWAGCQLCGSRLGGNFEVWHALDSEGQLIHGERACLDCVQYLANGTLPGEDES